MTQEYTAQTLPVAADLNGDGLTDIVYPAGGSASVSGGLWVCLSNGDGTFTKQNQGLAYATVVAVSDLNGDGILDLAYVHYGTIGPTGYFEVLLGKGDGTFTNLLSPVLPSVGTSQPIDLLTSDFNNDGLSDLALILSDNTLHVVLNNGDGTFRAVKESVSITSDSFNAISTADFNMDGNIDLAWVDESKKALVLLLGKGDGTFVQSTSNISATGLITLGDFNGDNIVDLSLAAADGSVQILFGGGDGTFTPGFHTVPGGGGVSLPTASDLNGDGLSDLIAGMQSKLVYVNNSDGSVSIAPALPIALISQISYTQDVVANVSPVAAGIHQVTAAYLGDSQYKPSTSTAVPLTGSAPSVTLTPASTSMTISQPGNPVSNSIQVASIQGYSGTVSLKCEVAYDGQGTANHMPTCSLSTAQGTVTPTSSLNTTLTIATTAATSSIRQQFSWQSSGEVLAAVVIFGLLPLRRSRRMYATLVMFLAATFAITGCSGKGAATPNTPPITTQPIADPGTTRGAYRLVVTATGPEDQISITIPINIP